MATKEELETAAELIKTAEIGMILEIEEAIQAFQEALADAIANIPATSPTTPAMAFYYRLSGNVSGMGGFDLETIKAQYGITPPVTP